MQESQLKAHTQNIFKQRSTETTYVYNKGAVKFNCEILVESLYKLYIYI